jgi:hypothetical protein
MHIDYDNTIHIFTLKYTVGIQYIPRYLHYLCVMITMMVMVSSSAKKTTEEIRHFHSSKNGRVMDIPI